MQQVGRNLTDCVDGFFRSSTHVILDRDTKHLPLRQILKSSDIEAVVLPPKSPHLTAPLERFMRSLKSECLNRMIFFGEGEMPEWEDLLLVEGGTDRDRAVAAAVQPSQTARRVGV